MVLVTYFTAVVSLRSRWKVELIMIVVSDTSPICYLLLIGEIDILGEVEYAERKNVKR